jgi:hypothetical protein
MRAMCTVFHSEAQIKGAITQTKRNGGIAPIR